MQKLSVAIVGGDLRFVRLTNILVNNGYHVVVYGLSHPDIPKEVYTATSLQEVEKCNYVVGPVPFTRDGKNIFTPLSNIEISIEDFLKYTCKSFLCLSALNKDIICLLDKHNAKYVDMLEMDEIAVLNAVPTAEGAIQYAMQNSEITIHGSKCLILGFGRCGKILAHKLQGIGAKVSVEARKTKDLAYIEAYGYSPIPLNELTTHLDKFDFIFNTIPVQILDAKNIDLIPQNTIYIELASMPGGIDIQYCKQKGILYVPAPSLPGKVAPQTAGSILYQGLQIIIHKRGENI